MTGLYRMGPDQGVVLVQRVERRKQDAQQQHVFQNGYGDAQYDIGYPEPRKVAQLAYQPSCDGYQQDDHQEHHDESSGS